MLYSSDYFIFLTAILLCMLISAIASGKVRSAYSKYSRRPIHSGLSGCDTANRLLRYGGVSGISVGRIGGSLTDHYNPTRGSVNLSESTYDGRSVASVAVAAHEIGHVMQKQTGYGLYRIRTALVPVVNIGSRLSFPLVLSYLRSLPCRSSWMQAGAQRRCCLSPVSLRRTRFPGHQRCSRQRQ